MEIVRFLSEEEKKAKYHFVCPKCNAELIFTEDDLHNLICPNCEHDLIRDVNISCRIDNDTYQKLLEKAKMRKNQIEVEDKIKLFDSIVKTMTIFKESNLPKQIEDCKYIHYNKYDTNFRAELEVEGYINFEKVFLYYYFKNNTKMPISAEIEVEEEYDKKNGYLYIKMPIKIEIVEYDKTQGYLWLNVEGSNNKKNVKSLIKLNLFDLQSSIRIDEEFSKQLESSFSG